MPRAPREGVYNRFLGMFLTDDVREIPLALQALPAYDSCQATPHCRGVDLAPLKGAEEVYSCSLKSARPVRLPTR